jgi:hypothetical protein
MSDYLWDPSAEADPEVEEFEEALSCIRYRANTSKLPERLESAIGARHTFRSSHLFAVAASVALLMLAFGVWLSWNNYQKQASLVQVAGGNQNYVLRDEAPKTNAGFEQSRDMILTTETTSELQKPRPKLQRNATPRKPLEKPDNGYNNGGSASSRVMVTKMPVRNLYASNAVNGEAAKEQIMLALQISSAKLSLAQRLAQGNAARQSKLNP